MKHQKIRNLAKSFGYAFRGLLYCVKNERNMRIHLCAVVLVCFFSHVYQLEKSRFLLLLLCFGIVIAAEVFNTALEMLVNLESPGYHPYARIVKDLAAGAVLVTALMSVVVGGVIFFGDLPRLWDTLVRLFGSPLYGTICLVLLVLSFLFVFQKQLLHPHKSREKERLNLADESSR